MARGVVLGGVLFYSTTVFVAPASNTEIENTDVKIGLASENLDKGKSIDRKSVV